MTNESTSSHSTLAAETLQVTRSPLRTAQAPGALLVGLTIVHHPEINRVGEQSRPMELQVGGTTSLSRTALDFCHPGESNARPLEDPFISRKPIELTRTPDGGVRIENTAGGTQLVINGQPCENEWACDAAALDSGVVLQLSNRVLLLLHSVVSLNQRIGGMNIVGESPRIEEVRQAIQQVADLKVPVLVQGESGSGKELVSQAIHHQSPRSEKPLVIVNMGAISPNLAASEIFGHKKGAFTGATANRPGYFADAHSGTLFLDEVGEMPDDVQVMLLRTLETSEIRPVGGNETRTVDVRLVAATDKDLQQAVEAGSFKLPLLHRLSGYVIRIPPLRERRDDIARLFVHFLKHDLEEIGESHRLARQASSEDSWVPVELVEKLLNYSWPGNVRQLRNLTRQFVISNRGNQEAVISGEVAVIVGAPDTAGQPAVQPPPLEQAAAPAPTAKRKPSDISEQELVGALRKSGWQPGQAAQLLGISKTSLYKLIEQSTAIRKAKDLSREELVAAQQSSGGRVEVMATKLEVSPRGIQLRMKELGLLGD